MPSFDMKFSTAATPETYPAWTKPTDQPGHFAKFTDAELSAIDLTYTLTAEFSTIEDAMDHAVNISGSTGFTIVGVCLSRTQP
jgi:hypothetical protein